MKKAESNDFLGRNLRHYRERNNLTQQQIEEKLNISDNYYNVLENGYKTPSVELFVQICKTMNVPAYCLIQEDAEALYFSNRNLFEKLQDCDQETLQKIIAALQFYDLALRHSDSPPDRTLLTPATEN